MRWPLVAAVLATVAVAAATLLVSAWTGRVAERRDARRKQER